MVVTSLLGVAARVKFAAPAAHRLYRRARIAAPDRTGPLRSRT
jgi:hypothetical protein